MVVGFLKNLIKSFKSMFNENNLAAAQIAQIFGSELLKVQQNAKTDSGHQPEIVKINPKQFLVNDARVQSHRREEERRMIEILQREAESTHPLPQPQYVPPQPSVSDPNTEIPVQRKSIPANETSLSRVITPNDVFERIAISLERIANKIDTLEIKQKRKTVKRKPKPKSLNQ